MASDVGFSCWLRAIDLNIPDKASGGSLRQDEPPLAGAGADVYRKAYLRGLGVSLKAVTESKL